MREWGLTFQRDSSIVNDFHREYLFQEGQESLWLLVQESADPPDGVFQLV